MVHTKWRSGSIRGSFRAFGKLSGGEQGCNGTPLGGGVRPHLETDIAAPEDVFAILSLPGSGWVLTSSKHLGGGGGLPRPPTSIPKGFPKGFP